MELQEILVILNVAWEFLSIIIFSIFMILGVVMFIDNRKTNKAQREFLKRANIELDNLEDGE